MSSVDGVAGESLTNGENPKVVRFALCPGSAVSLSLLSELERNPRTYVGV